MASRIAEPAAVTLTTAAGPVVIVVVTAPRGRGTSTLLPATLGRPGVAFGIAVPAPALTRGTAARGAATVVVIIGTAAGTPAAPVVIFVAAPRGRRAAPLLPTALGGPGM